MNPPKVIRVTADHIAKGQRCDSESCPIALAVSEQWGPCHRIQVDPAGIIVFPGDLDRWWTVDPPPLAAQLFMEAFDEGHSVEPFEFAVEWIDQDGVGA
jgi:hypothetical protein